MPYRMEYEPAQKKKRQGTGSRRAVLTVLLFILFLQMVHAFWPDGQNMLRILLIPGDPETTLQAAEVFAQEMECGYSLADAARNFYNSVLYHGNAG